jgi:hypothetical protein
VNYDALHPDLRPWVVPFCSNASMIKHPLVFYTLSHDAPRDDVTRANDFYEHKKECITKAVAENDLDTYIWAHERPYRLDALLYVWEASFASPEELGRLLGEVWIDSNNVFQNRRVWRRLWLDPGIDVTAAMDDDDRSALAALPDIVTVYRGTSHPRARAPLSWSLDYDRAHWFAAVRARPAGGRFLLTGRVRKKDIRAVLLGRKEMEVVALRVKVMSVRQIAEGEEPKWKPNQ